MTFKRFVADQVERLSAFEVFARLPEPGKKEFVEFLFSRSAEPKPSRDRSALDWKDSISAGQVVAVINECMGFEEVPSLADVRAVWNRLFPPMSELGKGCTRCNGSGWVTVQGPFGLSAAYPCTHGPETESDRRMGVKLSPAQSSQYRQESQRADATHVAFMQKRANGELKGFERVNQSDVDALLAHLGI